MPPHSRNARTLEGAERIGIEETAYDIWADDANSSPSALNTSGQHDRRTAMSAMSFIKTRDGDISTSPRSGNSGASAAPTIGSKETFGKQLPASGSLAISSYLPVDLRQ
jgi:hypothetical protein